MTSRSSSSTRSAPLVEHDRHPRTDLVETLEVWLETRNMAEAARRMYVHYNTFKNRLERIEAIIGPVLTDAAAASSARSRSTSPGTTTGLGRRVTGGM